jgi:TRAP-type C4-dicarboxylate transport system permease small subunit
MSIIYTAIKIINRFLCSIGAVGVIAMMLHICLDIIGRSIFQFSIPLTLEMVTRYYMLAIVLFPLGWVENKGSMIIVEAFSDQFGELYNKLIDALVAVFCASIYFFLAIGSWDKAMEQYNVTSYIIALNIKITVWPGYFFLPLSFGFATLVCLCKIHSFSQKKWAHA